MNSWQRLRGKPVLVHASEVVYRGVVVEMGPRSLVLRSESGFQEIPWDRIARLEEDEGGSGDRRSSRGPLPAGWE